MQPPPVDDDADDEQPAPNVAVPPQPRAGVQHVPAAAGREPAAGTERPGSGSRNAAAAGDPNGAGCRQPAAQPTAPFGGVAVPGHGRASRRSSPGSRASRSRSPPPRRPGGRIVSTLPLVDDVSAAIADAMRKHDPIRLSALRMLKAALMNREVERGRALDDAESRQVVASLVKQRKDSIEQFTNGGRQDLADKEAAEIRVLEAYLPPAADPAVVEQAVADAIAETGATSPKDMGRVMKAAMAKLAGQSVDGKTVNELVRQKLAGALNFLPAASV